jgi:HAD superfamily hydrolase (TIGR01450 family)
MPAEEIILDLKNLQLPDVEALQLPDVISIYESLRPIMPTPRTVTPTNLSRLVDVLPEVDALILDGYGVINVGDGPVTGIEELCEQAARRHVPIIVLTNGASFGAEMAWQKYQKWGLPIARDHVVSSRDALEAALENCAAEIVYGSLSGTSQPLGYGSELHYGKDDDLFERADEFVFLGTIDWHNDDQDRLEAAMRHRKRRLHVANPDVVSPQANGFAVEPGYWAMRAMKHADAPVSWYGKPHAAAFEMAFARLEAVTGQRFEKSRVAMVGDSLHTDIIGGSAFGLRSVLLTDYGLFRDGGARQMIDACGIYPDWIVDRL